MVPFEKQTALCGCTEIIVFFLHKVQHQIFRPLKSIVKNVRNQKFRSGMSMSNVFCLLLFYREDQHSLYNPYPETKVGHHPTCVTRSGCSQSSVTNKIIAIL